MIERSTPNARGTARAHYTGAVLAALVSLSSANAQANGRYPKADQLLIAADRPGFLAVRTTFGLLLSQDAGSDWDWVCESAIGYSGIQDPTLGLMENGTIIAGLSEGLARSTDLGCGWGFAEADLSDSPVVDLTVRKDPISSALSLVWDQQGSSYSSRFLQSDDNGRTFVPYGTPIDPSVLALTLDVAPSDAHRVYASGTRTVDGVRAGLLFTSTDDGEHWTEYPVPFDAKLEQGVYIAAVDPKDHDTVYLRTNSATTSRLLVTHDAGEHFEIAYSGSLLAFALSPDGSRLYFGGEDGLHSGLASDLSFEKRANLRLLCLAASEDTVFACSDEHSGFTVGASNDGGFNFEPLLHLKTVRGPLQCAADAAVAACASEWPLVRSQLGIPVPMDTDAGDQADAGSTSTTPTATDSSCAVASSALGTANGPGPGCVVLVASCWLSRRYRLRVRSRPPAR